MWRGSGTALAGPMFATPGLRENVIGLSVRRGQINRDQRIQNGIAGVAWCGGDFSRQGDSHRIAD